MHSDGRSQPGPQFLGDKLVRRGKVPFNVSLIYSPENISRHLDLQEAFDLLLPFLFVAFVSVQFLVRFYGCIDGVTPCVPKKQPEVEALIIECMGQSLAPNCPEQLGSKNIPGGLQVD